MVQWKAGNLQRYEYFVDDLTGLIVGTEYNMQTSLSGIPAMVMAHAQPIAINYAMIVNPFATNAVKTAQIHSWSYEEIARIDPAQRNSNPPCAYISVVNKSSEQMFSSLMLCIRLSQRLLAPVERWYTAAILQWTLYLDFKQSCRQRSGKWSPDYRTRPCLHAQQTFMR